VRAFDDDGRRAAADRVLDEPGAVAEAPAAGPRHEQIAARHLPGIVRNAGNVDLAVPVQRKGGIQRRQQLTQTHPDPSPSAQARLSLVGAFGAASYASLRRYSSSTNTDVSSSPSSGSGSK